MKGPRKKVLFKHEPKEAVGKETQMAINYRVSSIIIAAITILGAIFDSVQLLIPSRKVDHVYIYLDDLKLHQVLTTIANVVSVFTASGLYFVISIDVKTNVKRRNFLLPFIVWAFILCVWKVTAFTILVIKFGGQVDNVSYAMVFLSAMLMFIFGCIEASYYRLLRHDNGSKLVGRSLMLAESPFIRRKSRPSVTGRIYYSDSRPDKNDKNDKNNNNSFVKKQLKAMNDNVFIM